MAVQGSAIWKGMPGYLGAICICLGLHAMVFDRRKRHPITTKCRPCIERSWRRPFWRALHFQREAGWPYRGVRYGRECPVIWALSAYVRDRHAARESPSKKDFWHDLENFPGWHKVSENMPCGVGRNLGALKEELSAHGAKNRKRIQAV